MKFNLETRPAGKWSGDVLVLPYMDEKFLSHHWVDGVLKKIGPTLQKILKKSEFKGKSGDLYSFPPAGKVPFEHIFVLGLGKSKELDGETFCKAAARSAQEADKFRAKTLVSLIPLAAGKKIQARDAGQALAEGVILGLYQFNRYKSQKNDKRTLQSVHYVLGQKGQEAPFREGLRKGETVSQGVLLARDLINTPSLDKPPARLGQEARKCRGIRTRVYDERKIKRMGMGALYGVGRGSSNPPVFVEMHYRPRSRVRKRVALVGKGIVFDSGGLSLKPAKSMETMKDDMSGAAAVLGVMKVLPQLKLPVEVYGYLTCAENMPDGGAQRPGDVVKAYNGKTIEVLNTDAEGRLALADALSFVSKHRKVDYIIDLATLTGAALVALGDLYTAALGTDRELLQKLIRAGEHCGEKIWELPLAEEYNDEMKSQVADLQNIGGPWGGTNNGALFLKNFVPEKSKWVHLDIAGPSWANRPWAYSPKGGTGIMVRTLIRFLSQL